MADLVQKNESDSKKRRLYFYLVDATDGITPETGEANGQPQISVDGAAFTNDGVGTLVHSGNGHYYAEVTQATVNVDSGHIVGRFKSAATCEAPSFNRLGIVLWDPYETGTDITTVLSRMGSITGTGINTLLGFFKALFRKDASAPSDIGGTFDPDLHSIESIYGKIGILPGPGYNQASHSLVKIKEVVDEIASLIGGLSGGTRSEASPITGRFLARIVANVRGAINDPSIKPLYTDNRILDMIPVVWGEIWGDLALTADNPMVIRLDVTVETTEQNYHLPPMVGEILRISKIVTETGLSEWSVTPRSYYNPAGPGFTIEGNTLRFTPLWISGETIRLEYIPTGEAYPHEGTCLRETGGDANKVTIGTTPAAGLRDTRNGAYSGYLFRIFEVGSNAVTQERMVTAYDSATRGLTLATDLDPALDELDSHEYEVVPVFSLAMESLIEVGIARRIMGREGNKDKFATLTQEYREVVRSARLKVARINGVRAFRLEGDVRSNPRY